MHKASTGQVEPCYMEMQVEYAMERKPQNSCFFGLCFTSCLQASDLHWLTLVVDSDVDV